MYNITLEDIDRLEDEDPTVPAGFHPFFDRSIPIDIRSDISTDFQHQALCPSTNSRQ